MSDTKKVTLAQLRELAERADNRLDALEMGSPIGQSMTLTASGWTKNSGDVNYPYRYQLTVNGITSASRADAVLDAGSVYVASECGVCAVSETATNTVIFKSRTAPTSNLTGTLYITKEPATSGN